MTLLDFGLTVLACGIAFVGVDIAFAFLAERRMRKAQKGKQAAIEEMVGRMKEIALEEARASVALDGDPQPSDGWSDGWSRDGESALD